jgi:hypothetical protein
MMEATTKQRKKPYKKSEAVKHLEQLANKAAQKKYPNTPPEWLAPRRYRDDTSNGLTKCIVDFLRLQGWQAERINNMGRPVDGTKTFVDVVGNVRSVGQVTWIPGSGSKGTSDISATIAGQSVKIEVKMGRDRQSDEQMQYQWTVEQAGGVYLIARSFEEFLEWYKEGENGEKIFKLSRGVSEGCIRKHQGNNG